MLFYFLLLVLLRYATGFDLHTFAIEFQSDGAPQLAFGDLIDAYSLVQPNITLSMTKVIQYNSIINAVANPATTDFGVISSGLTDAQAIVHPELQMYPIMATAIVPVYRLDGMGTNSPQLVLTRSTLALIYLAQITWWNDSRIQSSNPGVVMPAQRITMVLPTSGVSTNMIITTAFGKFSSLFSSTIPPTTSPAWPIQNYSRSLTGVGSTGQASTVLLNDGSIGYAFLNVALAMNNRVAALVNKAGNVVQPTYETVTFATIELSTSSRSRTTATMDLTDGNGSSAWPITMMSFLLLDTVNSRTTCHVRSALLSFWLWYYESSSATTLLETRQYAPIPEIVLSELDVLNQLRNNVYCRNEPAAPSEVLNTRQLGSPASFQFIASLFTSLYSDQLSDVEWEVQSSTDDIILSQYINAELDLGFINPNNVNQDVLRAVLAKPDTYVVLPLFTTAIVYTYNPAITSTVNIAGQTLTLDMRTIGLINYACILHWNDPRILTQNPFLVPLLPDWSVTPILINQIQGCGSSALQAPNSWAMLSAIDDYIFTHNDTVLQQCVDSYPQTLWNAYYTCQSMPAYGLVYVTNEISVGPLVLGIPGAIGIQQAIGDPSLGVIVIKDSRNSQSPLLPTYGNNAGEAACALDTLTVPLGLSPSSRNPNCYRATQQILVLFRSIYSSSTTDATNCDRGYDSLQFIKWIITTPSIIALLVNNQITLLSSLDLSLETFRLDWLNQIRCDDQLLLVNLPVEWTLASGVRAFVLVVASLGVVALIIVALFVIHYARHPVVRSASPLFLFLSICGILLLFVSAYLLVFDASTETCAAFAWFVNFGLSLTFSPLFAKTWRIYRIFGRRKLSVVSISNRKLLFMVTCFLTFELLLNGIWQSYGNLQPLYTDVTTSEMVNTNVNALSQRSIVDEYVQCGISDGDSLSVFVVIAVVKALLFLGGALLGFSTRKVSSSFNESSGIIWSIYNVVFTIGVIAPIIQVIHATGDVLILLLEFALLWIACFTLGILFVPKMMAVYTQVREDANNSKLSGNATSKQQSSSSSGFVFLSLASLPNLPFIQSYLAALQKHTQQVQAKIEDMKRHGRNIVNVVPSTRKARLLDVKSPESVETRVLQQKIEDTTQTPSTLLKQGQSISLNTRRHIPIVKTSSISESIHN